VLRFRRIWRGEDVGMRRPRIAVIGAGNVGGTSAAVMAARGLGDVVLYDAADGLAAGKAMDINHASPFFHTDSQVTGCRRLSDLEDSDVVVIAAGTPRHAGMTRNDLLGANLEVLEALGDDIPRCCPHAKVLVVTNPVDVLAWILADRWTGVNVFGLGCTLDTVRFRFLLAQAAGASVDAVNALVIGAHNDTMLPLTRHASIGGVGIGHLLTVQQTAAVEKQTREAGNTIVAQLKDRGSFYAASYCVAETVEAIVRDRHAIFPLSVRCQGEYSQRDVCLALPCLVGKQGVESIIEMELDDQERAALDACAAETRRARRAVKLVRSS